MKMPIYENAPPPPPQKQKKVGAPFNNKNAEQWTFEEAKELFDKALEFDFIGEISRELGTYRHIFDYLSNKFKDLETIYKSILSNIEANCFYHAKKGDIKEATAIINLKSNYGWTDRVSAVNENKNVEIKPIEFVD
jgi:hypothetical protein